MLSCDFIIDSMIASSIYYFLSACFGIADGLFFMTTFDICSFSNMATETHFVNHIRTCGIFDIFWKMSILKNKKVFKHLALASFFHSKSLDKLKWYPILNLKKKLTRSSLSIKIPWQINWHILKILLFPSSASVDNKIYGVPDNKKLPFHPLG